MKISAYIHPKRPKIPLHDIIKIIQSVGATYSDKDPDIAIVVGGDGTFGYYGRILSIPLLFVGVHNLDSLGSKAQLAHIFIEDLAGSLIDIRNHKFFVCERRMLSVSYGTSKPRDVLTDIYLERGSFSGCIRYSVSVAAQVNIKNSREQGFTDYAIGNGVIISTAFGSSGYYSYPNRIKNNKNDDIYVEQFDDNRIGICHIIPAFLTRQSLNKRNRNHKTGNVQYTVPFESIIKVSLMRVADARLYGVTYGSKGVPINANEQITISPSNKRAKIIRLERGGKNTQFF